MRRDQGFSLVEVLIAAALTAILLGGTMSMLNDALGTNERTAQMADLEQNLRAGTNFLIRDFINAGWEIPTGGIPIPSGAGALPVKRPGPPGTNYTFTPSVTMAAVNPGASLGPMENARATDIVNILYADNLLPLNQSPLDAIAADGSSMTVNAGTPITGVPNEIRRGDLIGFSNALGNTLQCVTGVSGQIVSFEVGDPLNLNQPGAPQGSIMQLRSGGVFPPTTATRILLISYYLDNTTDPQMPRLIRQINDRPGEAVALVLEDLQLSYDLVDGVTNPTAVETPVPPNSPNQIRKVNIFLSGRSSLRMRNTDDFLHRTLTTQVSLRSLSFVDRYR
ncbi:MAG: prepilin-type N-terminal cleavage/methylation domain-containing protein [Acidobacteria bacterium]|nr:prepilin-type N-terminal cleavage/methylation domain-containing protein [Acidobacteriota bacterium]